MIHSATPIQTGAEQICNLYSLLAGHSGSPEDKLAVALPAFEAIQSLFRESKDSIPQLSQANFTHAGTCCEKLSAIQAILFAGASVDQDYQTHSSLKFTLIKKHVTTSCFQALNNEMNASLKGMQTRCKASSDAITELVRNYSANANKSEHAQKLVEDITVWLEAFKGSIISFAKEAEKIFQETNLKPLKAEHASPKVLQDFKATISEIKTEYTVIKKSITTIRNQLESLHSLIAPPVLPVHRIVVDDIIEERNPVEALQKHATMLKAYSDQLETLLAGSKVSPAQFLSICGDILEHLKATDGRKQALSLELERLKTAVALFCREHFKEFEEHPFDLLKDQAFLKSNFIEYAVQLLQYERVAKLAQECSDITMQQTFDRAFKLYNRAMNLEGLPHFDADGNFEQPFTFETDSWLVSSLELANLYDFKMFQKSFHRLEQKIKKIYKDIARTSDNFALPQSLNVLHKRVILWSTPSQI